MDDKILNTIIAIEKQIGIQYNQLAELEINDSINFEKNKKPILNNLKLLIEQEDKLLNKYIDIQKAEELMNLFIEIYKVDDMQMISSLFSNTLREFNPYERLYNYLCLKMEITEPITQVEYMGQVMMVDPTSAYVNSIIALVDQHIYETSFNNIIDLSKNYDNVEAKKIYTKLKYKYIAYNKSLESVIFDCNFNYNNIPVYNFVNIVAQNRLFANEKEICEISKQSLLDNILENLLKRYGDSKYENVFPIICSILNQLNLELLRKYKNQFEQVNISLVEIKDDSDNVIDDAIKQTNKKSNKKTKNKKYKYTNIK